MQNKQGGLAVVLTSRQKCPLSENICQLGTPFCLILTTFCAQLFIHLVFGAVEVNSVTSVSSVCSILLRVRAVCLDGEQLRSPLVTIKVSSSSDEAHRDAYCPVD